MPTTPFAEEHGALRDSVRRMVAQRIAPLAASAEAGEAVQRDAVALCADYRGLGDVLGDVVVAEELGRLRSGGLTAVLLDALLAADLKLPADGTVAVAHTGTVEVRDGGAHGLLRFVAGGAGAEQCLVIRSAVVITSGAGWAATAVPAPHGLTGAAPADLRLDGAAAQPHPVPPRVIATAELRAAAAAVSGAWQTFDDAVAYAQQRTAFGRPIGRFQTNRHALAEAATWLTAAEALVHDAAWAVATHGEGDTATPRLVAGRTARKVADLAVQLHGGYGYTMAFDAQRAWRDARGLAIGDSERRAAVLGGTP